MFSNVTWRGLLLEGGLVLERGLIIEDLRYIYLTADSYLLCLTNVSSETTANYVLRAQYRHCKIEHALPQTRLLAKLAEIFIPQFAQVDLCDRQSTRLLLRSGEQRRMIFSFKKNYARWE